MKAETATVPTDEEIDQELSARRAMLDEATAELAAATATITELRGLIEQAAHVRDTTTVPADAVVADVDLRRHQAALRGAAAARWAAAAKVEQTEHHLENLVDAVDSLRLGAALAAGLRVIAGVAEEAGAHAARAAHHAQDIDKVPGEVREFQHFLVSIPRTLARIEGGRPLDLLNVARAMGAPLPEPRPTYYHRRSVITVEDVLNARVVTA